MATNGESGGGLEFHPMDQFVVQPLFGSGAVHWYTPTNVTLWMEEMEAEPLGALLYFFEHAVAVSGYLLDVNPFNQPGVEDYKREMYSRLGRT